MRLESVSRIADTTSSSIFFDIAGFFIKFSYWLVFHVNVIWFWIYDNICLYGIDKKSGNRKYPHLKFVQYLETGAS